MKTLTSSAVPRSALPIRIIQFGEGNFLRAFVDWFIDELNTKTDYNAGVAVVQPIPQGLADLLQSQDGMYHHVIQGLENGKTVDEARLNTVIRQVIDPFKETHTFLRLGESAEVKLIFSNTTEAGITYNERDLPGDRLSATFPGKLLQLLHRRFEKLGDTQDSEIGIVPCELIENNGDQLRSCLLDYCRLWKLPEAFTNWVQARVHFANTLVDRIVPGYPRAEIDSIQERIGFIDKLVVKSESFHLFVIEGDDFIQQHFPAHLYGFNVKYVNSITPYRTQKVRILNGSHTSMVPVGLLSGIETVREATEDDAVGKFVEELIFEEVIPTIAIPDEDPKVFAHQVISRFKNPFIRHELKSISLNSISKWKVRVLPTLLDYVEKKGKIPRCLGFSLAALIQLYLSEDFEIQDDAATLELFQGLRKETVSVGEKASQIMKKVSLWDQDLTLIPGFEAFIISHITQIERDMTLALKELLS